MRFAKTFQLALSSIVSNKMRSFLTMLGIIIGVGAVIILVSVMDGVTGQVTDMFESLGTNTITVNVMSRGGTRQITPDDMYELVEKNQKLFSYVSPTVSIMGATVKSKTSADPLDSTTVTGVSEDYMSISKKELQNGRFLQFVDVDKMLKNCVVGSYVAKELFNGNAVGQTLKINGSPFKIVGVLEESADSEEGTADDCVYIPYTNAAKISWVRSINNYVLAAKTDDEVDRAVFALKQMLNKVMGNSNFFSVTAMKEILEEMDSITGTLKTALVCIAGISLLVGGIGIMNIMLVTVTERTREIGIRKSLGAKRRNILTQFVVEAGVVSALGGIIGIVFGAVVSYFAGRLLEITVTPSAGAVALAFGVSVAIGLIFGYLPASKASKLNPIDALRFE